MDLEDNPFVASQEEDFDENGCQVVEKAVHIEDQPMQDEQPKNLKMKDIKYTDTSKILKKDSNSIEKCRLTHSEYDDIAQRLEQSSGGPMALLRDAVSSKDNLLALREKVD